MPSHPSASRLPAHRPPSGWWISVDTPTDLHNNWAWRPRIALGSVEVVQDAGVVTTAIITVGEGSMLSPLRPQITSYPTTQRPVSPPGGRLNRWGKGISALLARPLSVLIPPSGWLTRVRRAFLHLSLILASLIIVQALTDPGRGIASILVILALGWLICHWVRAYRQPNASPLWNLTEGLMLLLAGVMLDSLQQPGELLLISLFFSSLGFQTLVGTDRQLVIKVLVHCLAYIGIMLMTLDGVITAYPLYAWAPVPGFVMLAVVTHLMAILMTRHDKEIGSHEILVRVGPELIAATDKRQIGQVIARACQELLANLPGVSVQVGFGAEEELVIRAGAGAMQNVGASIKPAHIPKRAYERLRAGQITQVDGLRSPDMCVALGLIPTPPTIVMVPLLVDQALRGLIILALDGPLPSHCHQSVRMLASQVIPVMERTSLVDDLRHREVVFRKLVQHSSDAITVIGEDATIWYQTPAFERLLGHSPADLAGAKFIDLLHPEDRREAVAWLYKFVEEPENGVPVEWRWRCQHGGWLEIETVPANLLDDPDIQGIVLTSRDVSARKALEGKLVHQAYHDPLTCLPNRARFNQRLMEALARPFGHRHGLVLMFLDLDRFKVINDTLGHGAGDHLLTEVARRLRECVTGEELVARLGGDEFAVLLEDAQPTAAFRLAERILERMHEPFRLEGRDVFVTPSIGLAISQTRNDRPEDLIRHADVAMYAAKRKGRACFEVFSPSMLQGAADRLALETDLRHAVKGQEFRVYYQPLIQLKTGGITEVEALVRWQHPTRGLLMPDEFIPLAEETGQIVALDDWVLQEACRHVRAWQMEHDHLPPLTLSVNLSASHFRQPALVTDIAGTLEKTGLDPRYLRLEITETVAMLDEAATADRLQALKRLGVRIAMDDFGTGYSGLNSLKRLPLDTLKIDRSFIAGLGSDQGDTAIVSAVISCARALGLAVTAEGIETQEQLIQLRKLACDHGQGYLFAKPLSWDVMNGQLSMHASTHGQPAALRRAS